MVLWAIIVPLLVFGFVSSNEVLSTSQTDRQTPIKSGESEANYGTNAQRFFNDINYLQEPENISAIKGPANEDVLQAVLEPHDQTNMKRRTDNPSNQNNSLNSVESHRKDPTRSQQQIKIVNNTLNGYLQFEKEEPHSETSDAGQKESPYTLPSLNLILSSILPDQIMGMFRLSYDAKSARAPKMLSLVKKRFNLTKDKKDNSEVAANIPSIQKTAPGLLSTTANVEDGSHASTNASEDSIQAVNSTAFDLTLTNPNDKLTNNTFGESMAIKQDQEDFNVSFVDDDNSVSASKIVSKQVFYIHPEEIESQPIETKEFSSNFGQRKNTYARDTADILQPTKQLDVFQEQVEKQFNPNALTVNIEAPSRTFLKKFENTLNANSARYKFPIKYKAIKPESLLHTYIYSSEADGNQFSNSCSVHNQFYPNGKPCKIKYNNQTVSGQLDPGNQLKKYTSAIGSDSQSGAPEQETKFIRRFGAKENSQTSQDSYLSTHWPPKQIKNNLGLHVTTPPTTNGNNRHFTHVDIHKSLNIYNKYVTERNGSLIEQHETYRGPDLDPNRSAAYPLVETSTPVSLSKNPIHVTPAEDLFGSPKELTNQQQDELKKQYVHVVESPVPYPIKIEKLVPQPYPVKQVIERYIDRPVHVDRIVEKEVKVPVTEYVERIVDRPVHVEKIIDRPVPVPYPVQVDRFIDRPYAVQVPVHIAVPVPFHQYIDRPFAVEKFIEKPIHVPYPVEKVIEKIVEKHVPVEVERVVKYQNAKPVQKNDDHSRKKAGDLSSEAQDALSVLNTNDLNKSAEVPFELVPPPFPLNNGWQRYQTLPEDVNILFFSFNEPAAHKGQDIPTVQPVKRGIRGKNIKRSPESGRNLRLEYGFKPPLVPSLEIDGNGYPVNVRRFINIET